MHNYVNMLVTFSHDQSIRLSYIRVKRKKISPKKKQTIAGNYTIIIDSWRCICTVRNITAFFFIIDLTSYFYFHFFSSFFHPLLLSLVALSWSKRKADFFFHIQKEAAQKSTQKEMSNNSAERTASSCYK